METQWRHPAVGEYTSGVIIKSLAHKLVQTYFRRSARAKRGFWENLATFGSFWHNLARVHVRVTIKSYAQELQQTHFRENAQSAEFGRFWQILAEAILLAADKNNRENKHEGNLFAFWRRNFFREKK